MTFQASKKFSRITLSTLFGAAILMGFGLAEAGVKGSKHDLGSGGASQQGATSATGEVCVFCHTPHGSDTTAAVPLWNKKLPGTAYTRYSSLGTSSLDGAEAPVGSVSLACLSCHDGTQAMDMVINKPGSGGYAAGGSAIDASAALTGTPLPNLGSDLSNDHPVSIQYAGGGLASTDADGTYTSAAFVDADFNTVEKATVNGNPIWWVDGDASATREKSEMQLYTRTLAAVTQPFVECASCHDPHNDSTAGAAQVAFLRTDNANSEVCLACHNK